MHSEICIEGDAMQLGDGLAVGGTVWKGTDGAAVSYCCGKSIYGQGVLLNELGTTINAQVEALGHGKWWLDRKTGSNKRYCQQCMCSIVITKETNGNRQMLSTKWIEHSRVLVAVSPAAKCIRMLSDPSRINGIKSKGIHASCKGKVLVERNNYATYSMGNVSIIPDFKIVFPKG
jgi:hypothetical protein